MKNILKKLYEVQMLMVRIKKTEDNPFFHSKYVPLDLMQAVLKPILNEHKLVVYHRGVAGGVETSVCDIEGECITSFFEIPLGIDPQKRGSAYTYGKRYNLGALFDVITDEDDDGNASSKPEIRTVKRIISKEEKEEKNIPF